MSDLYVLLSDDLIIKGTFGVQLIHQNIARCTATGLFLFGLTPLCCTDEHSRFQSGKASRGLTPPDSVI
jgi:hypothetical protein